jgi:competence protein ComEA
MRKVDETAEQAAGLRRRRKIIAAIALAVLCISFYGWWRKTRPVENVTVLQQSEVAEAARKSRTEMVVYVSGMVGHPGLLKVQPGARALDAVNVAGGLLPGADIAKINLAQPVRDGMQIHVPGRPQEQTSVGVNSYQVDAKAPGAATTAEAKININTADAAGLDKLPGVGPALAARIIEYRKTNGLFADGEALKKVPGVGPTKYEKLKQKITW